MTLKEKEKIRVIMEYLYNSETACEICDMIADPNVDNIQVLDKIIETNGE